MKTPFLQIRHIIIGLITLSLIGGAVWLWNDQFEQHWVSVPNLNSEAAKNNLLAAQRLLTQRDYQVEVVPALSQALRNLPTHGTLLLLDNNGNMSRFQGDDLLRWVKAGNTLVIRPKFNFYFIRPTAADSGPDLRNNPGSEGGEGGEGDVAPADQSDSANAPDNNDEDTGAGIDDENSPAQSSTSRDDPIATYLGVRLKEVFVPTKSDQQKPRGQTLGKQFLPKKRPYAKHVELAQPNYPLDIWQGTRRLIASDNAIAPITTDATGEILRLYGIGKGHIVLVADNYFSNQNIAAFDHAEVLLNLMRLQTASKQVQIIKDVAPTPWHELLLHALPYATASFALLLLLLLWRAMQRFGPLLPESLPPRRALLEHIDASARWLWQSAAGRDTLLQASRTATLHLMQRRVPEIFKLPTHEQLVHLHAACDIDLKRLQLALVAPVATPPQDYTVQIQTLQKLRQFYER
ncbi:MAG: DUF4350 domain-containing protein [Burkholderiaceae bacterium]|nr:DUF4350 domain-containing protein [Burkholderiaceae bacterium]